MAAYISVPRDLTKVKSKVAFNLTKRQLLCFGTAALIGVPLFFVLRDSGGNTAATLGMMAVMLPAFFLGMYEKNGQPMEKLLSYYVHVGETDVRIDTSAQGQSWDNEVISSTLPSTSTLRRTLKGMIQQPAEKTGRKHSFLKMV